MPEKRKLAGEIFKELTMISTVIFEQAGKLDV